MDIPRLVITAAIAAAALSAQSVSITATLVAPASVEARVGAQVSSFAQPAGLLPPSLSLFPAVPLGPQGRAEVLFQANVEQGSQPGFGVRSQANGFSLGGTPVSTSTGTFEVLLQVQATAPVVATLVVDRDMFASAGTASPMMRVDVGDDGSFEVTELSAAGANVGPLALGVQPLPVRLRYRADTVGDQVLEARLGVRFVADNALTITQQILGCTADFLSVAPSFQGAGLEFYVQPMMTGDLSVGVLGLGVQPVVTSVVYPGCILLPTPDVLVLMPSLVRSQLPLPANVRPLDMFLQAVVLPMSSSAAWSGSLVTTPGYRIQAF
jgi:hypothetical protein